MRKILTKLLSFLCLAALLTSIGYCGVRYFQEHYILWNGALYRRDSGTLDLRGNLPEDLESFHEFPALRKIDARGTGMTVEQYEWLREEFPGCSITWQLPFQGGYYDQDTEKITLTSLTGEEILLLDYLPALSSVDAWKCDDYAALAQLQRRRPDCKVFYSVFIGGREYDCDVTGLDIENVDYQELEQYLTYLPNVQQIRLTGSLPQVSQLETLQSGYPEVELTWQLEAFDQTLDKEITELDLRDSFVFSVEELEDQLGYFPQLQKVDVTGCGLPQAELADLAKRHPHIYFRHERTVGAITVSTDARELDLSNYPFESVAEVESVLHCFPNLEKVVMCECGIPYEDMAALNSRYEQIRFVWSVDLAGMLFRTDAVYFAPNKYGLKCTDENIADLRYCVDMVCVDIGHMEYVTGCEWAANMPKLKYLIMADSGVRDIAPLEGLTELVFLELFQSRVRDYTPLVTCTALEDLNLCYTYGDPTPLAEMTWLKRLWWSGCPWKGRQLLKDALTQTQFEITTVSSTGNGWREGQHYYDMRDFIGMGYMTG